MSLCCVLRSFCGPASLHSARDRIIRITAPPEPAAILDADALPVQQPEIGKAIGGYEVALTA
jgi:hypothetical protein